MQSENNSNVIPLLDNLYGSYLYQDNLIGENKVAEKCSSDINNYCDDFNGIYKRFINSFDDSLFSQERKLFLINRLYSSMNKPGSMELKNLFHQSFKYCINDLRNINILRKALNEKMENESLKNAFDKMSDREFSDNLYRLSSMYATDISCPERYAYINNFENILIQKYKV